MRRRAGGLLRSLKRKVRLGGERCDADTRQVTPSFVHHEAALPLREELPVEMEQVVELEVSFEPAQRRGLELLGASELACRRQKPGKRREVERDASVAVLAGPFDRLADQPLVETVGNLAQARHARE